MTVNPWLDFSVPLLKWSPGRACWKFQVAWKGITRWGVRLRQVTARCRCVTIWKSILCRAIGCCRWCPLRLPSQRRGCGLWWGTTKLCRRRRSTKNSITQTYWWPTLPCLIFWLSPHCLPWTHSSPPGVYKCHQRQSCQTGIPSSSQAWLSIVRLLCTLRFHLLR